MPDFKVVSPYEPAGDQPEAIAALAEGLNNGLRSQVLLGVTGSGKTYTAIALAVRALKNKEVKKLILCRPAVEAGEKLGFLPGDMKDKLDPYLQPLYDALMDMVPPQKLKLLMEEGLAMRNLLKTEYSSVALQLVEVK